MRKGEFNFKGRVKILFLAISVCLLVPDGNLLATGELTGQGELLTVFVSPQGAGSVSGPGISCPGDCMEILAYGASVTLTATPALGYQFDHWGGATTGSSNPVSFTMSEGPISVTAFFSVIQHTLTVSVSPEGGGVVAGPGINCPGDCEESVSQNTPLTLTATPAEGYQFDHWMGDARGSTNPATLIMARDKNVTAVFSLIPENRPPVLGPIGGKSVNEGELLSFNVSASDPDGDPLTFSATGLPGGAEFNTETGLFQWIPAIGQNGTYQVEFSVSDGEFTDSETVTIEVGTSFLSLPEPFPYDEVTPSQGAAGVDPEGVCFTWPEATNSEEYRFLVSRYRDFSSMDIEIEGLTEPLYCIGTATTSLTIGGLSEPQSNIRGPSASRTNVGLDYGQSYFWTVIGRNVHGEINYPVFGFFTQMLEGTEIESPQPLPDSAYQMISIPLDPENPNPMAVLEDDLGPYYPAKWRLFRYESSDAQNHEYPDVPAMEPGIAYWLIAKQGVKIDAQGTPVDMKSDFVICIPPGFFQLGCPFPFSVSWNDVKVRKGSVTVLIGDSGNEWISPFLWRYENGGYQLAEKLEPWEGYWVENVSDEEVELLIPPRMYVGIR